MADTAAVRQRRRRQHKAGDHSLCLADCSTGLEPTHDLEHATELYLDAPGTTYPVQVYEAVLRAAARAVDSAPTPGAIGAYNHALEVLAHATGRRSVITH